jgi:hypothetical protein
MQTLLKSLLIALLFLISAFSGRSQNCDLLDQLASFHGLILGSDISASFKKQIEPISHKLRDDYFFQPNDIESSQFLRKCAIWGPTVFAGISFFCVPKSSILYMVLLTDTLDFVDKQEISNGKLPGRFLNLYNYASGLFGSNTEMNVDSSMESLGMGRTENLIC